MQLARSLTWRHFFEMEALLRANKAPYPYFSVMHPYQWNRSGAGRICGRNPPPMRQPSLLEEVNSIFFVRQVGGVSVFVSANITIDSNGDGCSNRHVVTGRAGD